MRAVLQGGHRKTAYLIAKSKALNSGPELPLLMEEASVYISSIEKKYAEEQRLSETTSNKEDKAKRLKQLKENEQLPRDF